MGEEDDNLVVPSAHQYNHKNCWDWHPRQHPYKRIRCVCTDFDYFYPLLFNIGLFIVLVAAMAGIDIAAYERRIHNPETQILNDVLFDTFPRMNTTYANGFVFGWLGFAVVIVLGHRRRLTLLRRLFNLWWIMLLLRCITAALTSLPDPSAGCTGDNPLPSEWEATWHFQSCGDLIFSGHTTAAMTASYILLDAFPWRYAWTNIAFHIFSALMTFTSVFFVIASRFHYTIDCVLAILFTTLVWWVYHLLIDYPRFKNSYLLQTLEKDRFTETALVFEFCVSLNEEDHWPEWYYGWGEVERTASVFPELKPVAGGLIHSSSSSSSSSSSTPAKPSYAPIDVSGVSIYI